MNYRLIAVLAFGATISTAAAQQPADPVGASRPYCKAEGVEFSVGWQTRSPATGEILTCGADFAWHLTTKEAATAAAEEPPAEPPAPPAAEPAPPPQ